MRADCSRWAWSIDLMYSPDPGGLGLSGKLLGKLLEKKTVDSSQELSDKKVV